MSTRFFLFAENSEALDVKLAEAGTSLDEISGSFRAIGYEDIETYQTANGLSNNPWRIHDAGGRPVDTKGHDLGYGLAFEGVAGKVEGLLSSLRDFGVAGADLDGNLMTVAPNWENWCPGDDGAGTSGRRGDAERLIESSALKNVGLFGPAGLTGQNVNVIIVDQGLSEDYVADHGGQFGGGLFWPDFGFDPQKVPGRVDVPYVKRRRVHGNMIARNVLAFAPNAMVFDIPLIPHRIDQVEIFALKAAWAYLLIWVWVEVFISGKSVIVSAWGIPDRFRESVLGDYTANPDHPLNKAVNLLAGNHDVIFAAGNSGQFCPDKRTGIYDAGPGRSIWGANALERVISVGASRTDALWIGMSSQGPGPTSLGAAGQIINEKPDLCAPSWFRESHDAHLSNTGTSAACAVTAGVVAALRERWDAVPPRDMRAALRAGARKFWHQGWNGRMGEGVLNVPGTIGELP